MVCWPLVDALVPVFGAAEAPFERVVERAYVLLDQLLASALDQALPDQPIPALQLAETRLALHELAGARQAAQTVLDLAPGSVPGLLPVARIEQQAGSPGAARKRLAREARARHLRNRGRTTKSGASGSSRSTRCCRQRRGAGRPADAEHRGAV